MAFIFYAFYATLQIKCPHEYKQGKDKKTINREISLKVELSRVDPGIVQCIFSNNAIVYLHMRNIKCQILTLNTFKKRIITKSIKICI